MVLMWGGGCVCAGKVLAGVGSKVGKGQGGSVPVPPCVYPDKGLGTTQMSRRLECSSFVGEGEDRPPTPDK